MSCQTIPEIRSEPRWALGALTPGLLAATVLCLLLPKVMLISFINSVLSGSLGLRQSLAIVVQDLALAGVAFCAFGLVLRRPTWIRLAVCAALSGGMLFLLMLDGRVRELWLKPMDWGLVQYYRSNSRELASGTDVFFTHHAGMGLTFRRWIVLALFVHLLLWALTAWCWRRRMKAVEAGRPCIGWRVLLPGAGFTLGLVIVSGLLPSHVYSAQENIFISGLLRPMRFARSADRTVLARAEAFEQKPVSLEEALAGPCSLYEQKPARFKNVVVVILESIRWKGLGLDGSTGHVPTPTLRKLAQEGLLSRCYVSLPHSSKSQFAIMTGRHPYLGIEIREAMGDRVPSLLWSLRNSRQAKTWCFSVQSLTFENTDGMLRACGVESRVGPPQLIAASGPSAAGSSFGESDELLVDLPQRLIAEGNKPFAAVILTLSAHHPYNYPGKPDPADCGAESYWKSVEYSDQVLGRVVERMQQPGLARDTLFVFVGDHGESLGEHGTLIHNSSMHEEEVTVPLIFWSADGRLRRAGIVPGRQIDIAPTIADLMDLRDPEWRVQGRSLLRQQEPPAAFMASFFQGVSAAIVEGSIKWMYFPADGRVARYDLSADPDERSPLSVFGEQQRRIVERIEAFVACQKLLSESPPANHW